jgi:hypothetical protein
MSILDPQLKASCEAESPVWSVRPALEMEGQMHSTVGIGC